jgi:hypothetical protein
MPQSYLVGSGVVLTAAWRAEADPMLPPTEQSPYRDPSVVTLVVIDPAGVRTTYVYGVDARVQRANVGRYYATVEAALEGRWAYEWIGDGVAWAAGDGSFYVRSAA